MTEQLAHTYQEIPQAPSSESIAGVETIEFAHPGVADLYRVLDCYGYQTGVLAQATDAAELVERRLQLAYFKNELIAHRDNPQLQEAFNMWGMVYDTAGFLNQPGQPSERYNSLAAHAGYNAIPEKTDRFPRLTNVTDIIEYTERLRNLIKHPTSADMGISILDTDGNEQMLLLDNGNLVIAYKQANDPEQQMRVITVIPEYTQEKFERIVNKTLEPKRRHKKRSNALGEIKGMTFYVKNPETPIEQTHIDTNFSENAIEI